MVNEERSLIYRFNAFEESGDIEQKGCNIKYEL